jgi:branched-chain amino acid transport system substrate-binding protein
LAGCYAATHIINANGGVNGKTVKCSVFDTRGDPADAVPAARQMFASTPNLLMVIGPTSDEASAVVPIINAAKTVVFSGTGQSEFDQSPFPYFFRLTPPDIATAYAMIAAAHFKYHYTRIALAFGNDIGSQTFVKPAEQAIKTLGMTLADNEALNLTAQSYRTEVSKIVASHPDVILTEALGPADAIFLSEVKQLNGGKMIPVLGTSATIDPTWYSAVAAAVGAQTIQDNFAAATLGVDHSGAAYDTFQAAVIAEKANIKNYDKYLTHPQTLHFYDAVTLGALAAVAAKSNVSKVYAPFLKPIANGVPGATVVTSFEQGVALLKQGKAIRYIGPGGPTNFDNYNNSSVTFQLDKYGPAGATVLLGPVSASDIKAASG